jgi:hypothetical protein
LLLAALLSGCMTVSLSEESVFRPQKASALTVERLGPLASVYTLEPQTTTAPDGVRLQGVLLRRSGADRTVLYYGPNLGAVERTAPRIAGALAPLNVNVALFDYRGYGASGAGEVTTPNLMADAEAVFDHLTRLPGVRADTIVVHGLSLGSFMAGHVAARRPTAGVVLEGSATTAEAFARAQIPLAARPFVRLKISEGLSGQGNLQHMDDLEEPLLVLVGGKDTVTRPIFSRRLFEASTLPDDQKRLVVVDGATHENTIAQAASVAAYRDFLALTRRP